jgi:hypothetical protein
VNDDARRLLVEMKFLPEVMPNNFTFNKVREILQGLENLDHDKLREAIEVAGKLKIRGPLQAMIFIKHHLEGAHEVEVDRFAEGEEGRHFAVLVYPEGELTIQIEDLPAGVNVGSQLHYHPAKKKYC